MHIAPPFRLDRPEFTLRCWSPDDAPAFATALTASEAHLRAWTPWVLDGRVRGLSLEERLQRHASAFEAGTEWVYGIFSPDGSEVFGGCGLHPRIGPGAVEIGYWLAAHRTGRGLATTASAVLTDVAFASPDIDRVEIRCDPRNEASARVPQRLGYALAARIRDTGDGAGHGELMVWRLTRAGFAAQERDVPHP
jgi:RimJ/RimL family protein N-acetyltransferase